MLHLGGTIMNVGKWCVASLLAVTAWALMPETSQAQFFGRGFRGRGVSVGYGNGGYGYGSGWGNPGYYGGGWGPGVSIGIGNTYPAYYNNGYYRSGPAISSQPVVNGTTSTYQAFYPNMNNGVVSQAGDACGATPMQMAGANQGGGTLVVNVPENAQLFWNGTTPMVGNGGSRRFTLNADGTTQRIEARWTDTEGKTVTQTRDVTARPNDTVTVDFTDGVNGAANGQINGAIPPSPPNLDANNPDRK
jgi:hypothetical protein